VGLDTNALPESMKPGVRMGRPVVAAAVILPRISQFKRNYSVCATPSR